MSNLLSRASALFSTARRRQTRDRSGPPEGKLPSPAPEGGGPYQQKLSASFEARWALVSAHIPPGSSSLLDLGSNLGDFTARAAQSGLWSVGVEMSSKLVEQARARHREVPNCAFMCGTFSLADSIKIPSFDVILVLSVHHHWHARFGAEIAREMLQNIIKRTNKALIFEGTSRTTRYEVDMPDFIANDEDSVTCYYTKYLKEAVGALSGEIRPLGKAACVGEREPYRWMYAVMR